MIYDDSEFCSHIVLAKGILVSFVPMIFIFSFLLMFVAVCLCYSRIAFVMKNKLSLKNRTKDMASNTGSGALTSGGRPTSRNTVTWTYVKELYIKRKNKISPHVNNADQSNSVRNLDMITEVETVPHTYEGRIDNSTRGKLTNDVIITLKSFNQKSLHHRNTDKSPTVEQDANAVTWTEAKIYRTTKIMFFVTIVFVMSWIPTLAMFVIRRVVDYQRTVGGQVFALFARKAFLINTFTNPFFYIWMSSSFKERTRKTISVLFRCRAKNR